MFDTEYLGPEDDIMLEVFVGQEGKPSLYFGSIPVPFVDDIFPKGRRVFLENEEGNDYEGLVSEVSIVVTHLGSHVQVILD